MLLVIETALSALSVALLDGDRIVGEHHSIVGRGHAEALMPAIATVVADRGREVTAIVVDTGPGSFTGLRVGIAAARALGLAWDVPVTGVSSLALIAAATFADTSGLGEVTVVVDAGRGQLYVQRFGAGIVPFDAQPSSITPDALHMPTGAVIAGSGAVLVEGHLRRLNNGPPRAADVRHLPSTMWSLLPIPLYLRAPDAAAA